MKLPLFILASVLYLAALCVIVVFCWVNVEYSAYRYPTMKEWLLFNDNASPGLMVVIFAVLTATASSIYYKTYKFALSFGADRNITVTYKAVKWILYIIFTLFCAAIVFPLLLFGMGALFE